MSVRIEKLIAEYPDMVRDRKCLAYQIAHFRGLSAEEVIESMYTPRQDGERVQTGSLSDKTAQIAMSYRERLNREWYEHLEWRLRCVSDELDFFESAIRALSGELSSVMVCLVLDGMTWDATADALHMSRANIGKLRKKAILELRSLYGAEDCAGLCALRLRPALRDSTGVCHWDEGACVRERELLWYCIGAGDTVGAYGTAAV